MVVQMNIGPRRDQYFVGLFVYSISMWDGAGVAAGRCSKAAQLFLSRDQHHSQHWPCWEVPAVGAWRQPALGHCTAAP